jgi:pyruvate formate lyase activating enzyme
MKVVLEDRAFYEFSGGGVTLSGGEPLVQPAFSIALLGRCREAGIHTALDTSGHISWEVMEQALPFVDIMLYDLKHMNARDHRRLCGAENEITLANLQRLCQTGIPVEIRIPVVPSITDNPAMLRAAGSFLASLDNIVAVRLLPYHRLAGSKYHGIGRANTLPEVETPGRKQMEDVAACLQAEHILPIVISV